MKLSRRKFITATAAVAGGAALISRPAQASVDGTKQWWDTYSGGPVDVEPRAPGKPNEDYRPVVVPSGAKLPFRIVDGVKVFHLIAHEFEHEFMPGLKATVWGYNGNLNSTTIEAVEGDRIRIYVTNRLNAPTSVHWHGLFLPNGMDGVLSLEITIQKS